MNTADAVAFQDRMEDNYCWGCGAENVQGLRLKSFWDGDVAVAQWQPWHEHTAGPRHILNGGIIATLLDCHSVCTALADAYRRDGRAIGSMPELWYATASMTVEYLRPTPLPSTVHLTARVAAVDDRTTSVDCVLAADDKDRARASVRATLVPESWRHGSGPTS